MEASMSLARNTLLLRLLLTLLTLILRPSPAQALSCDVTTTTPCAQIPDTTSPPQKTDEVFTTPTPETNPGDKDCSQGALYNSNGAFFRYQDTNISFSIPITRFYWNTNYATNLKADLSLSSLFNPDGTLNDVVAIQLIQKQLLPATATL